LKTLLARCAALAALLLLGACAGAPLLDPARGNEKITASLDWLAQNSDYKTAAPLQHWTMLPRADMRDLAARLSLTGDDANPYAIYDCSQQKLFLWESDNLDDAVTVSYILRALTHHLQCVQKPTMERCDAEREASALQVMFVRGIPDLFAIKGYKPDDKLMALVEGTARRMELSTQIVCPPPQRES
jgi:hypothetical protein